LYRNGVSSAKLHFYLPRVTAEGRTAAQVTTAVTSVMKSRRSILYD